MSILKRIPPREDVYERTTYYAVEHKNGVIELALSEVHHRQWINGHSRYRDALYSEADACSFMEPALCYSDKFTGTPNWPEGLYHFTEEQIYQYLEKIADEWLSDEAIHQKRQEIIKEIDDEIAELQKKKAEILEEPLP